MCCRSAFALMILLSAGCSSSPAAEVGSARGGEASFPSFTGGNANGGSVNSTTPAGPSGGATAVSSTWATAPVETTDGSTGTGGSREGGASRGGVGGVGTMAADASANGGASGTPGITNHGGAGGNPTADHDAGADRGMAGAAGANPADAGSSGGGWLEQWAGGAIPSRFVKVATAPNAVKSAVLDSTAEDGHALQLTLAAGAQPSPGGRSEIETTDSYQYGSFSSRLRTADCTAQPNAGVVTGLFVYFNDGADTTGDGLPDNSEIDFEWLCAEPQTVYLTMWTDYRDGDGAQKRVSRSIDLASGRILYTCYYEVFGECKDRLGGREAQPDSIGLIAGYDSSARYYEYGFEWSAGRVVWWIRHPETREKTVLWDYQGPANRVPHLPSVFITNVWHTSDWAPDGRPAATASPVQPVSAWVDWTRYSPE